MVAYYNEIDPYACQWLRNLIAAGHIAAGDVDERSIIDVRPDDLRGYAQCHFFAGIGGWSLALRLAGWDDARPVWTGSCPCQPFSAAGKGAAADDERHLWPDWSRLIRDVRPAVVFGEQVEAAIGWGWLDLVHADLGAKGYATRFAVLPACGIGAPHIRQRLWFVADADGRHAGAEGLQRGGEHGQQQEDGRSGLLADADWRGWGGRPAHGGWQAGGDATRGSGGLGNTDTQGLSPRERAEFSEPQRDDQGRATEQPGRSPWSDLVWLPCADGKARPVEPGIFPLAARVPNRVGRLRAYGNAIVPQVAAEFIKASAI
jgi:DNA (cytosine-5)-methyltransferase 1